MPSHASRRDFLKTGGLLSAAVSTASALPGAAALPQVRLGRYSVSRLICGANPFNAGSHLSVFFNAELRRYFTPEQVLKTLRRCEEVGINTWQSGLVNLDLYRRHKDEGGKMHFISLESDPANIKKLVDGGAIAIAHHGEVSDRLYKKGNIEQIGDFLKRVRDAGALPGVSTHMPAVVDTVESKGWDLDFYMTCVYERHRSAADLEKLLGPGAYSGRRGLSAEGSAAHVQGDSGHQTHVPGIQDSGRGAAFGAARVGGKCLSRDLRRHQAGRRCDRRDVRPPERPAGAECRPGAPLRRRRVARIQIEENADQSISPLPSPRRAACGRGPGSPAAAARVTASAAASARRTSFSPRRSWKPGGSKRLSAMMPP